jgi:hypothetical protein
VNVNAPKLDHNKGLWQACVTMVINRRIPYRQESFSSAAYIVLNHFDSGVFLRNFPLSEHFCDNVQSAISIVEIPRTVCCHC